MEFSHEVGEGTKCCGEGASVVWLMTLFIPSQDVPRAFCLWVQLCCESKVLPLTHGVFPEMKARQSLSQAILQEWDVFVYVSALTN